MKLNNVSVQYKEKDALTASQPALILMTYDAALRFTAEAQQNMKKGDIPAKGTAIDSAFSCVAELRRALDFRKGGDIATSLSNLYDFMTTQITRANIANDPSLLEPVRKSLETLRSGWSEAIEKLKKDGALAEYNSPKIHGIVAK
jgi:flagellar protein FliS